MFQAPISNTLRDILLTRLHADIFQRGITPEREITLTRKNMRQLCFPEESMYEISKP